MLLQTNSYIVPADRRLDHQRLIRRFRQVMTKLGCESFEVYEQAGPNWGAAESTGRFVQIMRFRDRPHQRQVQTSERNDPTAQALIAEFCELINLPYQQQQGLFAVGFYTSVVATAPALQQAPDAEPSTEAEPAAKDQPAEDNADVEPAALELSSEPESAMEAVESAGGEAGPRVQDGSEGRTEPPVEPEEAEHDLENLEPELQPDAEPQPAGEARPEQEEPAAGAEDVAPQEAAPQNHQPIEPEEPQPRELVFEEPGEDEQGEMTESSVDMDIEAIAEEEVGEFEQSQEEHRRKD